MKAGQTNKKYFVTKAQHKEPLKIGKNPTHQTKLLNKCIDGHTDLKFPAGIHKENIGCNRKPSEKGIGKKLGVFGVAQLLGNTKKSLPKRNSCILSKKNDPTNEIQNLFGSGKKTSMCSSVEKNKSDSKKNIQIRCFRNNEKRLQIEEKTGDSKYRTSEKNQKFEETVVSLCKQNKLLKTEIENLRGEKKNLERIILQSDEKRSKQKAGMQKELRENKKFDIQAAESILEPQVWETEKKYLVEKNSSCLLLIAAQNKEIEELREKLYKL